jgi:hypothetical protein
MDKPPRFEPEVDLLVCYGMNSDRRDGTLIGIIRYHHQQVIHAAYCDETSCHGVKISLARISHNVLYLGKVESP